MVNSKKRLSRFAFTMIELIFAIVIISIAVISIPMMTQITSRGIESNILQEAIFAASAELNGATAYYWDRDSMQDNAFSNISRVIDVSVLGVQTCVNNASSPTNRLRPGHIAQPLHRRCVDSTTGDVADVTDATFPNLDNAEHVNQDITLDTSGAGILKSASGYKEGYKSTVDVVRLNNVKFITVTVTDAAANPIAVLRAQSANVGEIDYFKRMF